MTAVAATRSATGADGATHALALGVDHLLVRQDPEGWWKGELETNVTMDAEDLLLRHILGVLDADTAGPAARWIRANQREDGTWATFHGGPPDLSTTVEAYVALRLAGDPADSEHLAAAARWIRDHGGIAGTRVFTRIWLAMVGAWGWEDLPVLPPEVMFLPPWVPLNIYDFACWARQTVVALSVVMAHRRVWPLPFSLDELHSAGGAVQPKRSGGALGAAFRTLDHLLHRYERLPAWFLPRRWLRAAALRRAERWILERQEADGCWGGIQPPIVYSVIALHLQGYGLDHPVMRAALAGIDGFLITDERGRRVEACQSPVWDTALAVVALTDAGVPADHPAVRVAGEWLAGEEINVRGDWAVRRPKLAPGGWAFEFANVNYPDIDDTAEVVLALNRAGVAADARQRGVDWAVGLQSANGGWAAFDADNDSTLVAGLPFCDFGEVTDPPSADVTAHVIEMLAAEPHGHHHALRRGVAWLSDQQEDDGSWFGRWGVNHVYGTGAAVPALLAAGVATGDDRIQRALGWLEDHQNPDGGWGEDLRSYVDQSWRGRGHSTPSQTSWALLALVAAGQWHAPATRAGVAWLIAHQNADGGWDEPWFTGTGFPWDFTINYHLYRVVFPVMALGRYLAAVSEDPR